LDYDALLERMNIIKEDLMQRALRPDRVARWLESGVDVDDL
jgi:hypothetical protein